MNKIFRPALFGITLLILWQVPSTSAQDLNLEDYCKIRLASTSIPPFSLKKGQRGIISITNSEGWGRINSLSKFSVKVKPSNLDELGRLYALDSLIDRQRLILNCYHLYYGTLLIQLKQDYYRQLILHYEKLHESETDSLDKYKYGSLRDKFIGQRDNLDEGLSRSILNLNLPAIYYENGLKPSLTSKYITTDKKYNLDEALQRVEQAHPKLRRLNLIAQLLVSSKDEKELALHLQDLIFEEKEELKLEVRKMHHDMETYHRELLGLDYRYYSDSADFIELLDLSFQYNLARIKFLFVSKQGIFKPRSG